MDHVVRQFLWERRWAMLSLLAVVPVGFFYKYYRGPAANWVNNSLAGAFYEVFWCVLIALFWNRGKPWTIAASVLAATCGIEVLQLWHPPWLERARSTFIGRVVLGTSFTWFDFPYYLLGSGIGWMWVKWLSRRDREQSGADV